ncbi:triple tyrosine motif-containing protein [Clostridium sediminicola]|uniref:triple tyrosine motif-containing protein n=1 Tax=Clostridium sediminicola TaxID=3114879 RepID=UPI0031F21299
MNELNVRFNLNSPQKKFKEIIINVNKHSDEKLLYKYMIGYNGRWRTLKNYSMSTKAIWIPREDGNYIIMIQAKMSHSKKPFDYIYKCQYSIGNIKTNIIEKINVNKKEVIVGEKVLINVSPKDKGLMYKYIINQGENQIHYKEYSKENSIEYVTEYIGEHIITIQSKDEDSEVAFEDLKKTRIKVIPQEKYEIKSLIPCETLLYTENELKFKVDVQKCLKSKALYKFEKIDNENKNIILSDFSESNILKYNEKNPGSYTLVCYVKSKDSEEPFDDKTTLMYSVKLNAKEEEKFKEIEILTEDRQACEEETVLVQKAVAVDMDSYKDEEVKIKYITINKLINNGEEGFIDLEVFAEGGSEILYNYKINKSGNEDIIEYSTNNTLNFSTEKFGEYEIETTVKNIDADNKCYEKAITFVYIGENKIDYSIMGAKNEYLVGDKIVIDFHKNNIENLMYKYIIRLENTIIEEIDFSKNGKLIFQPRVEGGYSIDIVKKNIDTGIEKEYLNNTMICIKEFKTVKITDVHIDKDEYIIDYPITIRVESMYGEDVMYEFYINEDKNWKLVQNLSKKNYYTFLPRKLGKYSVFIIAKSRDSLSKYDDYKKIDLNIEMDIL